MASLLVVILFSLAGGLLSLIGGVFLLLNRKRATNLATYATPFAAGALLSAAFLDLLSEAGAYGGFESAMQATLFGILLFFFLERFLRWFHHHHEDEEKHHEKGVQPSMIVIGDIIHNFIDGIAIGAGFLVSVPTGIVVTLAVAVHEIPQEIGDFGLLLKKGLSPKSVLSINALSALATVIAAAGFFSIGDTDFINISVVLGLTAGFFIYIAVSDILPSIHEKESRQIAGPQTIMLILGVLIVGIATTTLHNYIDVSHGHEQSEVEDSHGQDPQDSEDSHGHEEDEEHAEER